MAFTQTSDLKTTPLFVDGQQVILRDYRHAANMFTVDQFRLAPKSNFLFHVSFGINVGALQNANIVQRYGQEINMLVKSTDLPSFSMQTEVLNQYNRKKVVQYKQTFGDIGMKFHDDNMGLVNALWQNYYTYYYADAKSANTTGAYARNATKNWSTVTTPYGFDNGATAPFFNYIKIYQMARHEYICYELHNPLISSWNYNKMSYSDQGVHDFDMKLQYEAVSFTVGAVEDGTMEGFGDTHYDHGPSPLSGTSDSMVSNPSFVQSLDTTGLGPGILYNAINTVNQNENTPGASGIGSIAAGVGGLTAGLGIAAAGIGLFNSLGGVAGISSAIDSVGGVIGDVGSAIGDAVGGISDALFPDTDNSRDFSVPFDSNDGTGTPFDPSSYGDG